MRLKLRLRLKRTRLARGLHLKEFGLSVESVVEGRARQQQQQAATSITKQTREKGTSIDIYYRVHYARELLQFYLPNLNRSGNGIGNRTSLPEQMQLLHQTSTCNTRSAQQSSIEHFFLFFFFLFPPTLLQFAK